MANQILNHEIKVSIKFPPSIVFEQIDGITTFNVSFDGEKIEDYYFGDGGFPTIIQTTKKIEFSCSGKITDSPGVKKLIKLMWGEPKKHNEIEYKIEWPIFAKGRVGQKVEGKATIDFGENQGGESSSTGELNFSLHCSGKPTFTAEV